MFEEPNKIQFYFLIDHADGSTTSGVSLATTYEGITSAETTTKISATSTYTTTIKDTTDEQSVQGTYNFII